MKKTLSIFSNDSDDANEKWSKPEALYIEMNNTKYECKDCHFWMNNKCSLYGREVGIKPYGSCNMWVFANGQSEEKVIDSYTKENTGYVENNGGFSCKICEYFDGKSSCKKVEGKISPNGCCNHWEKKD